MKKRIVLFLIILSIVTTAFSVAACDGDAADVAYELKVFYDGSQYAITWQADWAEYFKLTVYDKDGSERFATGEIRVHKYTHSLETGEYKVVVEAYKGDVFRKKEIFIAVEREDSSGGWYDPDDEIIPEIPDNAVMLKTYYYSKADGGELCIRLANKSGVKSVRAFELVQSDMWRYDKENNALYLTPVYIHRFSAGARLEFFLEHTDGESVEFFVQITDKKPLEILGGEKGYLTYNANDSIRVRFGYDGKEIKEAAKKFIPGTDFSSGIYGNDYGIYIDGKKTVLPDISSIAPLVTLSPNLLNDYTYGMHYMEIYTTYGKSEIWLNIKNGTRKRPYNVSVDFDSEYPNILVKWDLLRNDAEEISVNVDGASYSSLDYPHLFSGNRFDATGKISQYQSVSVSATFAGEIITCAKPATLKVDVKNGVISSYLSYNKKFNFLGRDHNYYISDFDEMRDFVSYSLIYYDSLPNTSRTGYEKAVTVYVDKDFCANSKNVSSNLSSAQDYMNEAIKGGGPLAGNWQLVENAGVDGVYNIYFNLKSRYVAGDWGGKAAIKENSFNDTHYAKDIFGDRIEQRGSNYDAFAINSASVAATVNYSEELYLAVERGIRPIPASGSDAQIIYEKAKSVLREIIVDDMSEFQKVHAIYDWLSENVTYDWNIAKDMEGTDSNSDEYNKFYTCRQLYLEGVFIDKVAVCNGYAKAVSLLCGIEGISAYKIKGGSGKADGLSSKKSPPQHAWNKVKIDGIWYVLDSTWANAKYSLTSSPSDSVEVLKHYTLLMSERSSGNYLGGAHYEMYMGDYRNYFAGEDFNTFANTFFYYGSNLYDYVIESKDELIILLRYYIGKYGERMRKDDFINVDVDCNSNEFSNFIAQVRYEPEFADYSFSVTNYASGTEYSTVLIRKK